jgi:hypothetical protein
VKPSPAVALAEPLVRGGALVTVHGTTELPDGRESQNVTVRLADGTELALDVHFATKEEL